MCGIAGIFHIETAKPVDPERVRRMTDSLVHRGPDGSGVWTAPGIGLGHRRLSIIDLDGSPQPMQTREERYTISFNGEIYNFLELREELAAMGHEFMTSGDTEVILASWRQWGAECVSRLHGMFTFAIHDAKEIKDAKAAQETDILYRYSHLLRILPSTFIINGIGHFLVVYELNESFL